MNHPETRKMGEPANRLRAHLTVGLVVLSLLVVACRVSDRLDEGISEDLPCDPPAQLVDLGRPGRSTLPAEVTLSGVSSGGS